ncbi:MAG: hypothetical protein HRT95_05750 [Moritella sp.]|uniref:hypothetical protein n=1 Tax=Moritella sp. TaxID=78556 RepID=UPI001D899A86|nr:hypothetical protein [Moritella sp.]NQZ49695.1 hypothetical protein [Moritella sp.]
MNTTRTVTKGAPGFNSSDTKSALAYIEQASSILAEGINFKNKGEFQVWVKSNWKDIVCKAREINLATVENILGKDSAGGDKILNILAVSVHAECKKREIQSKANMQYHHILKHDSE